MKKILFLGLVAIGLVGCSSINDGVHAQNSAHVTTKDTQIIHFVGPNDLTIQLTSNDGFETATLTDNSDKKHVLKRAVSASGVRLVNDEGVSIHFKNFNGLNEGTVELVKDRPIMIKEFKSN